MMPASGKISDYDAQWTCSVCKETFVVPSFARACETTHKQGNGHATS